jgi:GT2 family glycosyltransferase
MAYGSTRDGVPDVSVVISTCDRAESLTRAIESLQRQQLPPGLTCEVIVVDNNSRDGTSALLHRLVGRAPLELRCVFEPRQGVSHGRNAGIRASRAPIVAFTDDDNEVDPQWIATIKRLLDLHPEVAAVGGKILPEWPSAMPGWLDRQHWSPLAILDYGDQPFYSSSSDPRVLLTANLAVRRDELDRLGGFSPDFPRCQDHELLIRLWRAGGRVLYAPELVVRTRIARERLTRRYHRAWHTRHGFYSASMQLQEIIDRHGNLLTAPPDAIRLYGTPGFVYRELAGEIGKWAIASLKGGAAAALHHAYRIRYLGAYIRNNAGRHGATHRRWGREMLAFLGAHARQRTRMFSMTGPRAFSVHVLLAILVGGSACDMMTGREHWPFSPYAMFSTAEREPVLEALRVMGVTREAVPREIPLLDSRVIRPFDQCRLRTAFERTYHNPVRRPLTQELLRDCLARYESLRASGAFDGPPLQAIRLYEMKWMLDGKARNVAAPDQKRLLAEARDAVAAGF